MDGGMLNVVRKSQRGREVRRNSLCVYEIVFSGLGLGLGQNKELVWVYAFRTIKDEEDT